jgi:4-amino-4-deoxy-L-arabinose transferase-like glycosyltransferase
VLLSPLSSRDARSVIGLASLGVAVRLAVPVLVYLTIGHLNEYSTPDSKEYLALAVTLLTTGSYQRNVYRPPGFPMFLLPAAATDHPLAMTAVLNALVGGATVVMAYATAYRIAGARGARCAGFFCAIEPGQVLLSGFMLADTLLAGFAMAVGWAGVSYLSSPRRGRLLVLGILAAGAAYVKTVAYFLPIWLAGCLWLCGKGKIRQRLQGSVMLLAVSGTLLGLWHVRNYFVDGYRGFSTQIERAALYREVSAVRASREGIPFEVAREREAEALGTTPGASARVWRRYFGLIVEDPGGVIRLHVQGALRMFTMPWRSPLPKERRSGAVWSLVSATTLAVRWLYLALAALAVGLERPPRLRCLLVAVGVYFVLLATGTAATADASRFLLPIMPIVSVMAGLTAARVLSGRRQPLFGFGLR